MLTLADREEVSRGLAESLEYKEIAVRIDRDAGTGGGHGFGGPGYCCND
jgi:hypothetical protein